MVKELSAEARGQVEMRRGQIQGFNIAKSCNRYFGSYWAAFESIADMSANGKCFTEVRRW